MVRKLPVQNAIRECRYHQATVRAWFRTQTHVVISSVACGRSATTMTIAYNNSIRDVYQGLAFG
jgi:hypothetical protein